MTTDFSAEKEMEAIEDDSDEDDVKRKCNVSLVKILCFAMFLKYSFFIQKLPVFIFFYSSLS